MIHRSMRLEIDTKLSIPVQRKINFLSLVYDRLDRS